jgi:ribonucleotide reductase alpha subunit
MNTVVKLETKDVNSISFQDASLDIWDKKYRLVSKTGQPIDKTMDDTYKRVARALADVERPRTASTGTSASCGRCAAAPSLPAA